MPCRRLALALAALLVTACPPRAAEAPPPNGAPPANLVLRSYDVPNNGAERLRGVLKELLWLNANGKEASTTYIGRADVAPDGRLLVLAPESVQEGVRALVTSVSTKPVKPPGTLRLAYWAVLGAPNKGDPAPLEEALKEVAPALAEVEKTDGRQTFSLLEKLSSSALSGERAWLSGRDVNVYQYASIEQGVVVAEVKVERPRLGQRYEARVQLKAGQLVVLASAGSASKEPNEAGRTVYFLLRAFSNDGE